MQSIVARSILVAGMLCRATMVGRSSERVNWRLILQLGNTNLSNWLVSLQNLFRFVGNLFLKKKKIITIITTRLLERKGNYTRWRQLRFHMILCFEQKEGGGGEGGVIRGIVV